MNYFDGPRINIDQLVARTFASSSSLWKMRLIDSKACRGSTDIKQIQTTGSDNLSLLQEGRRISNCIKNYVGRVGSTSDKRKRTLQENHKKCASHAYLRQESLGIVLKSKS